MPLIVCPRCGRITYAYPIYDNGEITAYRCSECYNVFNVDQVNIIPFPNVEIILKGAFAEILAEVDRITVDEVYERYDDIAEQFYNALLYLTRPIQPRINKHKVAHWDYRGTREAEEYNEELFEEVQRVFAEDVDKYLVVVEIREIDEGDSLFISIHPDDVDIIINTLKHHDYILSVN